MILLPIWLEADDQYENEQFWELLSYRCFFFNEYLLNSHCSRFLNNLFCCTHKLYESVNSIFDKIHKSNTNLTSTNRIILKSIILNWIQIQYFLRLQSLRWLGFFLWFIRWTSNGWKSLIKMTFQLEHCLIPKIPLMIFRKLVACQSHKYNSSYNFFLNKKNKIN